MATFYLDPIGGNDANDGTTFANRWQSLTSGATAARIAAGDVVRVIASPDIQDTAQNATWTEGSSNLTLTTAVTANIEQLASWTSAVTNTSITTNTNRKLGSTSASCTIAAGFTTGKACYKTISSTDFSAYQQVSFWINMTSGSMSADANISIVLCSDTLGATPVNTINVPRIKVNNTWHAVTVDTGGALGSAIQSVALYVNQDRGAQTFLVNNVLACKAPSAADSITLSSLVSKNTGNEPWLGIQSINGTAIVLDLNPQLNLSTTASKGYAGSTATVNLYKREPLIIPTAFQGTSNQSTSTWGTINDAGSAYTTRLTISGGWDRTNMSSQTGDTYISGVNQSDAGLLCNNGSSFRYVTIEKINPTRFHTGFSIYGTGIVDIEITAKDSNNNQYGIYIGSSTVGNNAYNNVVTIDNIQGNTTAGVYYNGGSSNNVFNIVNLNSNYVHGLATLTTSSTNGGLTVVGEQWNITNNSYNGAIAGIMGAGILLSSASRCVATIGTQKNNTQNVGLGITSALSGSYLGAQNNRIIITGSSSMSGGGSGNFYFGPGAVNNTIVLTGATVSNTSSGGVFVTRGGFGNKILNGSSTASGVYNFTMQDAGTIYSQNLAISGVHYSISGNGYQELYFGKYNATANDHRLYTNVGNITTSQTQRHTASGYAWLVTMGNSFLPSFQNNASPTNPLSLTIGKSLVGASALVTASVWVYRSSTNHNVGLTIEGSQVGGVTSDVTTWASGSANTWEQLTITFTPSEYGVVEFQVDNYTLSSTTTCYIDDFSVSQA